ncbi:uncharacterized protein ACHE_10029A [Neofusicoccum parvum]|nr:uncharacterized protein ACHE_10029A [Neofusicoccum parvum]
MDPSTQTILITGTSGHAGAHILLAFLARGYAVLAAVRSQSSASKVSRTLATHATPAQQSRVSFAVVPDITAPGAFDGAVSGADGIVHVASPVRPAGGSSDVVADILDPAVAGTLGLLDSARSHGPRVRRVVVTGSMVAVMPFGTSVVAADHVFTEEDWMSIDRDVAVKSGHPGIAYAASKVLAERAALEYGARHPGLRFGVVTVVPPSIFGPQINAVDSLDGLNLTPAAVWSIVSGDLAGREPPSLRRFFPYQIQ